MKSNEMVYDDLTAIKGIGSARQRWLRESLYVCIYQDLADLSIAQIESQLKADGKIASQSAIKAWRIQAQELASANPSSQSDLGSTDAKVANKKTNSLVRENGWKEFASFVVEFQTREVGGLAGEHRTAVHHMERDTGTYWPGIEHKDLCQWMLDQICDKVALEPKEHGLAQAPPVQKPPAKVKITQIRVFQPPQSKKPTMRIKASKPFRGSVKSDKPFTFEVDFELAGPAVADIVKKQIECNARSYVYAKGKSIELGITGPHTLEQGKFNFTFTLPKATLQRGKYRLWVLVTTQQATLVIPDYIEVPLFQVV